MRLLHRGGGGISGKFLSLIGLVEKTQSKG